MQKYDIIEKNHSFYFVCFEELRIIALGEKILFESLNTFKKIAIVNVSVPTHNLGLSLVLQDVLTCNHIWNHWYTRSPWRKSNSEEAHEGINWHLLTALGFCHFMATVYFNLCKNIPISLTEIEKLKSKMFSFILIPWVSNTSQSKIQNNKTDVKVECLYIFFVHFEFEIWLWNNIKGHHPLSIRWHIVKISLSPLLEIPQSNKENKNRDENSFPITSKIWLKRTHISINKIPLKQTRIIKHCYY